MKGLGIIILLFMLLQSEASSEVKAVNFLGGFKATRLVNDTLYCATEGGLRIYDVSDRTNPQVLSEIVVSDSGNVDIEVSGSHVFVLSGYIFLEQSNITVVDVSNPAEPRIVSRYDDLEDNQSTDILIHEHWLIVANGERIDFIDISNPQQLKRFSRITITTPEGGVRGLALQNGTLFAVWSNLPDGGLDAVDISNISRPNRIVTYYFPRFQGFSRPAGYLTASNSAVYVSVPTLGLLVFDAQRPEYLVPVTSFEGEAFYGIDSVYAEGDLLFMNLVSLDQQRDIAVFDISNATSPSKMSQTPIAASVSGMDSDPDRNEVYLGVFPSAGFGVGIFHVDDGNLAKISEHLVSTPTDVLTSNNNVFLTVSDGLIFGRIMGNNMEINGRLAISGQPGSVKISGTKAYVSSLDKSGRTLMNVVDITNPQNMRLLGKFPMRGIQEYLAQDAFDTAGSNFYLASPNGLRIYDASNPNHPRQIGFHPIQASLGGGIVKVQSGIAFVGTLHFKTANDGERIALDLHVIDVKDPQSLKLIARKTISFTTALTGVAMKNGHLYLMFAGTGLGLLPVGEGQLAIVDIRTPSKPEVLFSGFTRKRGTGYAEEIAFRENFAFIADGLDGVTVLNLLNPTRPEIIATLPTPGYAKAVSVDNRGQIHVTDNSSYIIFQWP